jgi:anti-anti-sigma factor
MDEDNGQSENREMETRLLGRLHQVVLEDSSPERSFSIQVKIRAGVTFLVFTGCVLSVPRQDFMERIDDLFAKISRRGTVLDLSRCDYLASSALALLIEMFDASAKFGGQLIMLKPNQRILNVMSLLQFDEFFHMVETVDEALQYMTDNKLLSRFG